MSAPLQNQLTTHASQRSAQRAVRSEAVTAALTWGTEFPQRFGRSAFYIDTEAVRRAARSDDDVSHWAGTAVVVGEDGGVITVIHTTDVQRLKRFGQPPRTRRRER